MGKSSKVVRAKFPHLTCTGAQLVEKSVPLVEAVDAKFFEKLDEELQTFVKLSQKLL